MKIGLQISSLKKYLQTPDDLAATFRRVREIGYTQLQLQWMAEDIPCEFIAEQLKANGFDCWGTQDYYDVVMARLDYEIRAGRLYGSRYICVSGIPERFMSMEGVKLMASELKRTAARLADEGYVLTFHPRAQEYVRFGQDTATEMLMDMVPEMQMTLDAYHTEVSGIDTLALMRKYAGRMDLIHLKNSTPKVRGGQLMPVGAGDIDFAPIIEACPAAGIKVVFAEQESWKTDAFDCMRQSYDYLKGKIDEG